MVDHYMVDRNGVSTFAFAARAICASAIAKLRSQLILVATHEEASARRRSEGCQNSPSKNKNKFLNTCMILNNEKHVRVIVYCIEYKYVDKVCEW